MAGIVASQAMTVNSQRTGITYGKIINDLLRGAPHFFVATNLKIHESQNTTMTRSVAATAALLLLCSHEIIGNNEDMFTYDYNTLLDERTFGVKDWDQVSCSEFGKCVRFMLNQSHILAQKLLV